MKIYHRLFGDLPKLGFGKVIGSIGFPGGVEWVDEAKSARLPLDMPMLPEQNINGLIEYHEAYEYQTIRYGQPAVILSMRSVSVADGHSRPHAYSHVAAPSGQAAGEISTDYITPSQLICFDAFTTMEEFWALPKGTVTLPVTDWQPPDVASCSLPCETVISEDMHKTLLLRYWKTISARAFSGKSVYPLEIYLNDDGNCKNIIRGAKAFFAAKIIPFIPIPAQNILSMSAAVPKLYKHIFKQSALVFLYPETETVESPLTFDLRSGSYVPLSDEEAAFAGRLMRQQASSLLDAVYQRYQRATNGLSPTHCPFMADYLVAFHIDCLEHGNARDAAVMLGHWKAIWEQLRGCHGLQEDQCYTILEPVMSFVLKRLRGEAVMQNVGEAWIPFVIGQAVLAEEKSTATELIELLGKANVLTVAVAPSIKPLPERTERIALIVDMILNTYCINAPLSATEVQSLIQLAFIEYFKAHESLSEVMRKYIKDMLKRYPENYLTMLPLSRHFLNGYKLLSQSIHYLLQTVDTTPDDASLNDIRNMFMQFGNEENRQLLADYMAACFWRYRHADGMLVYIFRQIGADTADTYRAVLLSGADPATRLDRPIAMEELYGLRSGGEEMPDSMRQALGAVLASYVDQVLVHSLDARINQFRWLWSLDPQRLFLTDQFRIMKVFDYAIQWIQRTDTPLDTEDFRTLIGIIGNQGRQLFIKHESEFAAAYENLGPKGQSQADALIPYLSRVKEYPFLCSVYTAALRQQLYAAWTATQEYWRPIGDVSNEAAAKGILVDSIVDQSIEAAGRGVLHERYKRAASANSFLAELDKYNANPKNVFYDIWFGELRDALIAQYSVLVMDARGTFEDLLAMKRTVKSLKAADALANNYEKICFDAIMAAYDTCEAFPEQSQQQVVDQTQYAIQNLTRCCQYPAYGHMQALLANHYISGKSSTFPVCRFFAQVAAGLICSVLREGSFNPDILLRMILSLFGIRSPSQLLAVPNPQIRQAFVSLFQILSYFDYRYPDVLLKHMETVPGYAEYTARIRSDRHSLHHWDSVNLNDTPALRRWLNI